MVGGRPPPLAASRGAKEGGWVPPAQPWAVSLPHPWLEEVSIPTAVWGMSEAAAGQGPGRGSHLRVVALERLHDHLVMGGPERRAGEALVALC